MEHYSFDSLYRLVRNDDLLTRLKTTDKPIVLYGMGNGADKMCSVLSALGKEPADFMASEGFVRGQYFRGKKVLSYRELKEKYKDFTLLIVFGSRIPQVIEAVKDLSLREEMYIPDLPLAGEDLFTLSYLSEHKKEIDVCFRTLEDNRSKSVLFYTLAYKVTGKADYLFQSVFEEDKYGLLRPKTIREAVDVGGYRGDTLDEWSKTFPELATVLSIEPDPKNYRKLLEKAKACPFPVRCVNEAAWESDGELVFYASHNRNATARKGDDGGVKTSFEAKETVVPCRKIDSLLQGDKADYIKYDTEGAEKEALLGTRTTIEKYTPKTQG
ncbi:MAG: FkbM family methyltransferase, partial [Clostridia bacterium]|nr:FkbM family methyltransferase [Clostridia bacterium]